MSGDAPKARRAGARAGAEVLRHLLPWLLVVVLGALLAWGGAEYLRSSQGSEKLVWRSPNARWLAVGGVLVGLIAFQLRRRRAAAMGFSQVGLVGARGPLAWLSDLPGVLRVLAVGALAFALARPETYRTVTHKTESIDIMIVFDMSKSMEETDIPRDRFDAAQRVIRKFLRRTKDDRVGLVIFGQQAMLHTPLTQDMKALEQIVRDLQIGDVPELGTAIGDGLAMALASLRRSDGQCARIGEDDPVCPKDFPRCSTKGFCEGKKRNKIVILLSDGDNNWTTRFEPDEAARQAAEMGVRVYTILVGREESDVWGGMSVNPATLRSMASITDGEFFRATDFESFDRGFQAVRTTLDKISRVRKERIPDKQLFVGFAAMAALLFALDLLLSHTFLRRLP
ncbi:MAG TPA: VWA domain-containing protein [Kofleriaceae bacterium]|nr:VWA domain-containing protein [Kofleriaceae bacterium]